MCKTSQDRLRIDLGMQRQETAEPKKGRKLPEVPDLGVCPVLRSTPALNSSPSRHFYLFSSFLRFLSSIHRVSLCSPLHGIVARAFELQCQVYDNFKTISLYIDNYTTLYPILSAKTCIGWGLNRSEGMRLHLEKTHVVRNLCAGYIKALVQG